MIRKIIVPKISANITDATLTAWFKNEGDAINKGEPLLELTTEKAAFEVEAPCNGVLRKKLASKKSILPAGYVLALVGGASDSLPDVESANRKLIAKHRASIRAVAKPKKDLSSRKSKVRVRATPAARRIARENSIELSVVSPAKGSEVITEELVLNYLKLKKDGAK